MKLKMTMAAVAIAGCCSSATADDDIQTRTLYVDRIVNSTLIMARDMESNTPLYIRLAMVQAPSDRYRLNNESERALGNLLAGSAPITAHVIERSMNGTQYAFVENANGKIVNAEMVRAGKLIATSEFTGNESLAPFMFAMQDAHNKAFSESAGLWGTPHAGHFSAISMEIQP